jgi:hypothetical protein
MPPDQYDGWNADELRKEFDWLTQQRKSVRLRIAVLDAEIAEKEHECKIEQGMLEYLDNDYSILVEVISQRNGD